MAQCEVCGNDYDKSFEVMAAGSSHVFDSFECAIQALAPICGHCGCKVIGHGTEVAGKFFCSAHCAKTETSSDVKDRAA
jgi:Rieske Fe-S protein